MLPPSPSLPCPAIYCSVPTPLAIGPLAGNGAQILPEPEFRLHGGCFILTVRRKTGQVSEQAKTSDVNVLQEIFAAYSQATGQATGQVTEQVMAACQSPQSGAQLQLLIGISHRETFLANYLNPMLKSGWIERTIPDKPTSRLQKYRLTDKGREWLEKTRPLARRNSKGEDDV